MLNYLLAVFSLANSFCKSKITFWAMRDGFFIFLNDKGEWNTLIPSGSCIGSDNHNLLKSFETELILLDFWVFWCVCNFRSVDAACLKS